ncbi:MAG: mechanosensitive ion channel family protein [Bacteroidaceae bacterium]|nr:mechanosensitive ion channel family protein [Bacteroidaceae bacterium]
MRRLILLVLGLLLLLPAKAVLKERSLPATLSVLRVELKKSVEEQQVFLGRFEVMSEAQHKKLIDIIERSSQISLMLYSQKQNYTFDLTYACNEATTQYRDFQKNKMPYDRILGYLDTEISRYEGLIVALKNMPRGKAKKNEEAIPDSLREVPNDEDGEPLVLTEEEEADRLACIEYAETLLNGIRQLRKKITRDNNFYDRISERLKTIYDYAQVRFHDIQHSIFKNAGENYFATLQNLPRAIQRAKQDVLDKYSNHDYENVHTEWRGPIVFGFVGFIIFYLILAVVLSNVIVRLVLRYVKRFQTETIQKRKPAIIMVSCVLFFILSIMVARLIVSQNNFYIMATSLLVEYAWLLVVIYTSLLIRLRADQVKSGFVVYFPIVLMGLFVIIFRIIFIPNYLVSLIFPPLLLVFFIWQWFVIRKHREQISRSDVFYTWVSIVVMGVSCIMAWLGYVLMAVQVLIWWLFQLTAIQTITCLIDLLDIYKKRYISRRINRYNKKYKRVLASGHGTIITVTWFFDFISMALVPMMGVYSVIYSIYWAADVFDLAQTCITIFVYPFLNVEGVIQLSLFKLVVVSAAYFLFKYLNYAFKAFYRHYKLSDFMRKNGGRMVRRNEINLTLANNVASILIWGVYIVGATVLLNIPKSGISIVTAGLATGVGFAMKDLLNNFFYGVSLMAGRIRVGDYIECDGVLGKVESITYQSTQVVTLDGSVMAILNSSLFAKNFKNLTRNHSYEFLKIPIGVAYGVNVNEVREMLKEELYKLVKVDNYGRSIIDKQKGFNVILNDFGESSVDLAVTCWVLVSEKNAFGYKIREVIYETLNKHNIEIPFPQRDVHIKEK